MNSRLARMIAAIRSGAPIRCARLTLELLIRARAVSAQGVASASGAVPGDFRSSPTGYEPRNTRFARVAACAMLVCFLGAGAAALAVRGAGILGPPAALILMWFSINTGIMAVSIPIQGIRPLRYRRALTFAADVAVGAWAASWSAPLWCAAVFAVWVVISRAVEIRTCPPNEYWYAAPLHVWTALELSGLATGWGVMALWLAARR